MRNAIFFTIYHRRQRVVIAISALSKLGNAHFQFEGSYKNLFPACLSKKFDHCKVKNRHSTLIFFSASLKYFQSKIQDLQIHRRSIYFPIVIVSGLKKGYCLLSYSTDGESWQITFSFKIPWFGLLKIKEEIENIHASEKILTNFPCKH